MASYGLAITVHRPFTEAVEATRAARWPTTASAF